MNKITRKIRHPRIAFSLHNFNLKFLALRWKLKDDAFKLSDLSIKFSCNFNVLENGISPKQIGLKDILNDFLQFRKQTIKRNLKIVYKML